MSRPLTSAQLKLKKKALGAELRALRKANGETQHALAARAGLSLPPVVEMERGTTSYKVDSLIQLCHAHGVDLAALVAQAGRSKE